MAIMAVKVLVVMVEMESNLLLQVRLLIMLVEGAEVNLLPEELQ